MKARRARRKTPKVRRRWKIHPATRVERDETAYDRKKAKLDFRRAVDRGQ